MKSIRQIDLLGAAVLAVLVCATLAGPVRARISEHGRLAAQHRTTLLRLAEYGELENRLLSTEEEVASLKENIETLHRSFPPRKDLDSFLSELNGLARSTGAELVRVVPGTSREGEVFSMTAIQMEARSSFENLYGFLWGLNRMTRLSQIETLGVTCDPNTGVCTAEITLHIFISARGTPT